LIFPVLGQTLGAYRLLQGIALGGRAAVFHGCDERSGRLVALKVPVEGALAGPAARQRLRREAAALEKLRHPSIVPFIDYDSQDEIDFLVLEWVEGPTLADRLLREGPLEEAAVLALGDQLASALAEAHRHGVLHCDVKPGNVLLPPDSPPKLIDFGQARLEGEDASIPDSRKALREDAGTIPYMAPEWYQGRRPDARVDIWSLGVLLYEAVTGRRPFHGEDPEEIVAAVLGETPAPPSAVRPGLSARFDRIILGALEKNPDRRYPSAGACPHSAAEHPQ
jgi:eukaryotic-like serine/threonine-protein kinase